MGISFSTVVFFTVGDLICSSKSLGVGFEKINFSFTLMCSFIFNTLG